MISTEIKTFIKNSLQKEKQYASQTMTSLKKIKAEHNMPILI